MSDQPEEPGLDELERQLDAAFATTRPRRAFEDELWERLEAGRPRRRLAWPRSFNWGLAGSVAVVLLIGVVAVTLARSAGGRGGGASMSAPADTRSGAAVGTAAQAPSALAFGLLPSPPAAGVTRVTIAGALSPLPDGAARLAPVAPTLPQFAASLPVYRYDPATGPAAGTVLEHVAPPAGARSAAYPTRQPGEAIAEAAAKEAASSPNAQQAEVALTQVSLVYVAVLSDGSGYLEPAYLFTGTAQSGGATAVPARVLVPAIAASALR